jgi:hypothetical protein
MDTQWGSWLKHQGTSRKVKSLIPDKVVEFFILPNPSSYAIAMGSPQPLTEMSNKNLPGVKGRRSHKADKLTPAYEPIV